MMLRIVLAAVMAAFFFAGAAHAQSTLLQGGPWAPGRAPMYVGQGFTQPIVQDSGPAAGGGPGVGLSELGLTVRGNGTPPYANAGTGFLGTNFCDYDAPTTNPTGYHFLCFGPNSQGGGLLAYGAGGGAANLPLQISVNGTLYQFPFPSTGSTGLTVANNAALQALASTVSPFVTRASFVTAGDAPLQLYVASPNACSLNSGNGDNGSQVKSSDGGCWNAVFGPGAADVREWGATGTNSTVDTAAIAAALLAVPNVQLASGVTYTGGNWVVGGGHTLNCNRALLKAGVGAQWIIKKTSDKSFIKDCSLDDSLNNTLLSTTLATGASPGVTVITVANATGMVAGMPISIALSCGAHHVTRIFSKSGNTITLNDAIPSCATGATVVSPGSGYITGDAVTLYQTGSSGPPTTFVATASAGSLTAVAVEAGGLYTTPPSNPVTVYDSDAQAATGATVNVTFAGAASGASVAAAYGVIWDDQSVEGGITGTRMGVVPVGLQISNTAQSSAIEEYVGDMVINAATLVGIFKDVGVSQVQMQNVTVYGYGGSPGTVGPACMYVNGEHVGAVATGGNKYSQVNLLNCEIGVLMHNAQLDDYTGVVTDTIGYYGWVIEASSNLTMNGTEATFIGPSGPNYGGGYYIGSGSINISMGGSTVTQSNGFDIAFDNSTQSVWLTSSAWHSSKTIVGGADALYSSGSQQMTGYSAAASGGGTGFYIGGTGSSTTTGNVGWLAGQNEFASIFTCNVSVAPGAGQTDTCTLNVNGSDVPQATCTISDANTACSWLGPSFLILRSARIQMHVTSSGGAAAALFRTLITAQ